MYQDSWGQAALVFGLMLQLHTEMVISYTFVVFACMHFIPFIVKGFACKQSNIYLHEEDIFPLTVVSFHSSSVRTTFTATLKPFKLQSEAS